MRALFKEIQDYGWTLAYEPFEYSAKYECIWVTFKHEAFPRVHLTIEVNFRDGLTSKNTICVSDDDIDGAGDSMDVLVQQTFDPDEIWKICEGVMAARELWILQHG